MTRVDGARAEIVLSVPFFDCDPLFVVWHGHYLKYFEQARSALLAKCRLDVKDVQALGFRMFVTDARCRYTYPLSYGEELRVEAALVETSPLLHIAYRVTNLTRGRASARGYTKLALTDARGNLLAPAPAAVLTRLATAAEQAEQT